MKDGIKFAAYFLGVIVLGCLLAPPLWWVGQSVGGALSADFLTDQTFQRYFNRSVLVAAVVLLWPMIRWLAIRSWRDFGIAPNRFWKRDLASGFTAAFFLLLLMGMVSVALGVYELHGTIRWEKYWKIPGTMVAVSLLEEAFFRGVMLGLVLRSAKPLPALAFVSAIFSVVHFLKPMEVEMGEVHWLSGFALLPYSFHQFAEPLLLLGGFTTLFAIGWVLGHSRLATRSLWMAIGLHAGWIAGNRVFNITFKQQENLWPWFGPRIEIGVAPLLTVILTGLLVAFLLRRRHAPPPPAA